jgi:FixJ family two-component response regulator
MAGAVCATLGFGADVENGMSTVPLISIVDDDETVRASTMDLISSMGLSAKTFGCADEFLRSEALDRTACLIADMRMPGMSGLELYRRLVETSKAIPTIIVTAFPDDRDRVRARQSGVKCYLAKPFNDRELLECVRAALDKAAER